MSGEQAMNKEEINCQHLNFFLALYCLPQWFSCEKDPSFHGENSFPDGSVVKNLPAVQEMWVWSLGGEDLREGSGNPLQYLFLGNPMDRGAWQATVHGVVRVRHDLVTKLPPPPRQSMWSKQGNMTTLEPQTLKFKSLIFKRIWM